MSLREAQERYYKIKEDLREAEELLVSLEKDFLARSGVVNADGNPPLRLEDVDSEETWGRLVDSFSADRIASKTSHNCTELERQLCEAEDAILEQAYELVPEAEAEILRKAAGSSVIKRHIILQKMLGLE